MVPSFRLASLRASPFRAVLARYLVLLLIAATCVPLEAASAIQQVPTGPAELQPRRDGQTSWGDTLFARYDFKSGETVSLYVEGDSLVIDYWLFRNITAAFSSFDDTEANTFRAGFGFGDAKLWFYLEYSKYIILFILILIPLMLFLLVQLVKSRRSERKALEDQKRILRTRRYVEQSREDERKRLARELHDGPLQTLYALRMNLALVDQSPRQHDATVGEVASELRGLTDTLRSPLLSGYGLGEALRTLAERHRETSGTTVDLTIDPDLFSDEDPDAIPEQQTTALFRMTQEALSNVARHSQATRVRVVLRREDVEGAKGVSLIIEDDGSGFDLPRRLEDLAETGHYGLLGQRERAEILGGELLIWSVPGQGTRLTVWVPLHVSDSLLELHLLHASS